jgi:hypothetical protein
MFKKINSNRDPDVTVGKEIKREFSKYFDMAEMSGKGFINTYPKQIFIGMLTLIAFSIIMCFVVYSPTERQKEKMPHFERGSTDVAMKVTDGITETYKLGAKVTDLVALRSQVEEVLKKPRLTHQDTIFLEQAIKQFEVQQQKTKK